MTVEFIDAIVTAVMISYFPSKGARGEASMLERQKKENIVWHGFVSQLYQARTSTFYRKYTPSPVGHCRIQREQERCWGPQ